MEEKVLSKGLFSKFNFITGIFIFFAIFGLIGIAAFGAEDEVSTIVGFIYIIVGTVGAIFFYNLFNKCDITVTNKRVYGKAAFGKRVDLPLDKISSVSTCAFKGVGVATSSGRIKFLLCKNRDDVFNTISKLLLERQNQQKSKESVIKQEIPQSNADELKKYKELFDSGIITQEEFDAKKKQLLGL